VYLVGEGDKIIPPQLQLAMADVAGSEIVKCEAGHMAVLSAPEKVVQVIFGAVKSVS
jgi:pimeloyl-ACP methyl ester carboxylesterase